MIVYFAAPDDAAELALLQDEGVMHILVAFGAAGFRRTMDQALGMGFHILLDSGAYSAFSRGRAVEITEYADCLRDYADAVDAYVNLDVCGDPVATMRNQDWLESKGYRPMPVWHFGEPESVLAQLLERRYDYIGLGSSVLSSRRSQNRFCEWVWRTTTQLRGVRFHGFAVGALEPRLMGLASCDATTWQIGARFGRQIGRYGVVRGERYGLFWTRQELLRHNIRALLWQQHNISALPGTEQPLFG